MPRSLATKDRLTEVAGQRCQDRTHIHRVVLLELCVITLSRWNKILPMYQITDKDREVVSSSSSGNK
jgi:hypothetical protein